MKSSDMIVLVVAGCIAALFCCVPAATDAFRFLNVEHSYLMSFVKFGVLSTFGECLALRLKTGRYCRPGFGMLPRLLAWGLLGLGVKTAFVIFATGTPHVLSYLGLPVSERTIVEGGLALKILTAFSISLAMNCIFAPVLMIAHKLSDLRIARTGGSVAGYVSAKLDMAELFQEIDWGVMWGFVIKKTIPLFWVPAHTITFLLPSHLQVLFAAMLGVVLGVILSLAAQAPRRDMDLAGQAL